MSTRDRRNKETDSKTGTRGGVAFPDPGLYIIRSWNGCVIMLHGLRHDIRLDQPGLPEHL